MHYLSDAEMGSTHCATHFGFMSLLCKGLRNRLSLKEGRYGPVRGTAR